MPKKNSSKRPTATTEESDPGQQKLSETTDKIDLKRKTPEAEKPANPGDSNSNLKKTNKKKTDEIDEIFATLKKRKAELAKAVKSGDTKDKLKTKKSKNPRETVAFNNDPKPKRRTNDGFVIYTEEELGMNNKDAGGTALCPFDCSCCF